MEDPSAIENTPSLPDEMPVMVLQDCHLFPGCLLPLFIFEERYRTMLAHALATNRMFCIGNREGKRESSPISEFSTAGLVRCCVKQDDGTSQLLLLGLNRVRIVDWIQEKPFRIARIESVDTVIRDREASNGLVSRAINLFKASGGSESGELLGALEKSGDAELVCDVLSYHFTRCPKLQQRLLGEPVLERRFELLIEALEQSKCD